MGKVVDVVGTAVVAVVGAVVVDPIAVVVVGLGEDVVVVAGTVVLVVGGGAAAHAALVKVSLSSETWPLRASARPWTTTPVVTEIDVNAKIVPLNDDVVPRVAELPTCQKTLHA